MSGCKEGAQLGVGSHEIGPAIASESGAKSSPGHEPPEGSKEGIGHISKTTSKCTALVAKHTKTAIKVL